MKKWITLLCTLGLLVGVSACSKAPTTSASPEPIPATGSEFPETPVSSAPTGNGEITPAETVVSAFLDMENTDSMTPEEIASQIIDQKLVPVDCEATAVTPGFLPGFSEDITGFINACNFGAIISPIPYTGYIFQLETESDADNFIQQLQDKANLNWNVCTSADEMKIAQKGDKVIFVMAPASFDD